MINRTISTCMIYTFFQGWVLDDCRVSRTPRGQNLVALASNLSGLGLDAIRLRLGVLVSVAGIHANVIQSIAKIHLVPSTCTYSRLVLASAEVSTYRSIVMLTAYSSMVHLAK
jgi:hypothetical protein